MDSVKQTMAEMSAVFTTRMAQFEADLQRSTPSTPSSIAADFDAFKLFMVTALNSLKRQVELLSQDAERREIRSRRRILLIHGIVESKDEIAAEMFLNVAHERLKLAGLTRHDISRSHRIGQHNNDKPRPILVKFGDMLNRDKVWFSKTMLKGSGITITEFLTGERHKLFMEARRRFGMSNCWTRDGCVYIMGSNNNKQRVNSIADLDKIPASASAQIAATVTGPSLAAGPSAPKIQDRMRRRFPAKK